MLILVGGAIFYEIEGPDEIRRVNATINKHAAANVKVMKVRDGACASVRLCVTARSIEAARRDGGHEPAAACLPPRRRCVSPALVG